MKATKKVRKIYDDGKKQGYVFLKEEEAIEREYYNGDLSVEDLHKWADTLDDTFFNVYKLPVYESVYIFDKRFTEFVEIYFDHKVGKIRWKVRFHRRHEYMRLVKNLTNKFGDQWDRMGQNTKSVREISQQEWRGHYLFNDPKKCSLGIPIRSFLRINTETGYPITTVAEVIAKAVKRIQIISDGDDNKGKGNEAKIWKRYK